MTTALFATKHEHTSGCMNTYPDCMDIEHSHGGVRHAHACTYSDGHLHPEEVPSPGNEPAAFECMYYAGNATSHCMRPAASGKLYCEKHCAAQRRAFAEPRTCSIIACDIETDRKGQPCDPCYMELGVG